MDADVVVVGGGAAGIVVARELHQAGMRPFEDFVVLDAQPSPGGTWNEGWDFLRVADADDLVELPGMDVLGLSYAGAAGRERARDLVPETHRRYEDASDIYVHRPARVSRVEAIARDRRLRVTYRIGSREPSQLRARVLINATGRWSSPFAPWYPGRDEFAGIQRHAMRLGATSDLAGARVLVVGGGRSAVAVLRALEGRAASTLWATRRPPEFAPVAATTTADLRAARAVLDADAAAVRSAWASASAFTASASSTASRSAWAPFETWRGRGFRSMPDVPRPDAYASSVSLTGIPATPAACAAVRRGLLVSRGPLERLTPTGAVLADGSRHELDAVVWATGTRESVRHLAPLGLRAGGAAPRLRDGWSRIDPRIAFVGYGAGYERGRAALDARRIAEMAIDRADHAEPAERGHAWL